MTPYSQYTLPLPFFPPKKLSASIAAFAPSSPSVLPIGIRSSAHHQPRKSVFKGRLKSPISFQIEIIYCGFVIMEETLGTGANSRYRVSLSEFTIVAQCLRYEVIGCASIKSHQITDVELGIQRDKHLSLRCEEGLQDSSKQLPGNDSIERVEPPDKSKGLVNKVEMNLDIVVYVRYFFVVLSFVTGLTRSGYRQGLATKNKFEVPTFMVMFHHINDSMLEILCCIRSYFLATVMDFEIVVMVTILPLKDHICRSHYFCQPQMGS
ncbi:unnamed protein product [Lactuca virosa]|uniref:Uncharacterized protein n=1 Tax=Lactuca virosa TaxID=75947 RepID=A0AAU9LMZ6_9ASTR|nr:unnamed protein product [Lactuca virosa]